ncbi:aminotransferase class I/II-fold pyridoxal phosphate-dependent enzyme [Lyticum sinuosum]|uniref:5-aminolevulinate synthase n=1 Tax=Lyticum sinuosum TaxID=1332059 RepID=A0AAE4VL93_9RICK|nr:aminotransferase class I/II-fold pyridoxal phosphate-dependent enzyme [Lyticum sinuosum]MDZ5761588.1 8-amino-7-oxononanoate synthase [Lyticum sinuosum]
MTNIKTHINLYNDELSTLKKKGYYRKLPEKVYNKNNIESNNFNDSNYNLNFSTNDYLNLSHHPEIIKAGFDAMNKYGVGSTGSRLLSGNISLYEEFEEIIAKNKNTESSIIFNSGFQANITVLSSLLDYRVLKCYPIVFFDKLNHSSLYQAIFLSKAELHRYYHNDLNHLVKLMEKYKYDIRPKFLVTETVFGMDGDVIDIEKIISLTKEFNILLYLDEAHATGLFGPKGYGLSTSIKMDNIDYIVMGTFSKALGVSGAYIACSSIIKEYLINKCPGIIYSTAPSPAVIGCSFKSWQMIEFMNNERLYLQDLANILRLELKNLDFDIGESTTHIIPIILNDEYKTLYAQKELLKNNIITSAIRPPTASSSRLRIALTTKHNYKSIDHLLKYIIKLIK